MRYREQEIKDKRKSTFLGTGSNYRESSLKHTARRDEDYFTKKIK